MKNFAPILTVAAVMFSCGPKGHAEIPVLDVTKSYPAKNLVLQEIADVEYIPLETREGFLIDYFNAKYMDDRIVITNNSAGDIMIFDRRTGKGITSFNRQGRGPGEYGGVSSISVDRRAGEMFVPGLRGSGRAWPVHVYDMLGKHLRTLEYRNADYSTSIHDYDAEHMIGYNTVYPKMRETDSEPNPYPYALLSKTDTLITPLPLRFEGRQTMAIEFSRDGVVIGFSIRNNSNMAETVDGYILSEPGIDTIYHWNRSSGELTPVMTRTPSFNSMEYPVALFCTGVSDDYLFLETFERRNVEGRSPIEGTAQLIYDKRAGEFYTGTLVNGDYVDQPAIARSVQPGVPAGQLVVGLQPIELQELHKAGKLRGRLAEVAATLKEDDNPVMMVATFK